MSALRLRLFTVLCAFSSALGDSDGVVWRAPGGSITINCRPSSANQKSLSLKKGLVEDSAVDVLFQERNSEESTVAGPFRDRLQLNGRFPDVSILIRNLSADDTGPYHCKYTTFDRSAGQTVTEYGRGSVLLVVTEEKAQQCDPSNTNLIMIAVVISAVVLIGIVLVFLACVIVKTRTLRRATKKPRRAPNNDVYEEMRGTVRR